MAAKDLMFKIAILDETKQSLDEIKKNLADLQRYADGVSQGVTSAVKSIKELGNGFKIEVPDLSTFAEQIGKIDKALGKKDAFKVKDLEDALNTIKKFGEQLGENPIKRNDIAQTLDTMSKQMETGAKKMSTATTSSLETYRDQLKGATKDIETNISAIKERVKNLFDSNGNLPQGSVINLRKFFGFDKGGPMTSAEMTEFVKGFENALTRVQDRLKNYDKSIINNQYLVGDIGKIKEDLNQLETAVTAVRNGLSSKGLLGNMPENTNKEIAKVTEIVGKLDALEQKLQSFGNGSYPNVMQGFLGAVSEAFDKIDKVVAERTQKALNMSVYTGGGSTEASEAHKANEQAIKGETEAIKQQEQEVKSLTEALEKLKSQRSAADNLLAKAYLNSYNSLTNKWDNPREVQEWMMSYIKRFTKPDENGTYHLDDQLFRNMLQKMGDRYLFRGGVDTKAYSQLFGANGLFANSAYSLSREPGVGFSATITPDLEAIKAYKKEKQDAAQVVKQADTEIAEAEQKLANAQAKLTQATTQQAAAQEKLNSTQQKTTQPKQTEINFSEQAKSEAAKMVTPFEEVEKRINDIISRISSSVSSGLDTAFSKNLDSSALVTSLKGFIDNLNKLDESLQQMNKLAEVTTAAQTLLMHAKENLQSASKGGKTITSTGTTEGAEEGTDPRTYAKNINALTNAMLSLNKAYMSVMESRNKLAASGKDTTAADNYLHRIDEYMQKLGDLRTRQDVISQKGLLLENEDNAKLFAKALDEPIEKTEQLLKIIRELGNATPMGETYQKLMAGANMFRMDARDADVAARLRDTSRSNLERRDIMSRALADIPVADLRVAGNRFSKATVDQANEAMRISGLAKSINDIMQFKDKMDALTESELNQKGKVANLQAEYNKLTSIYRKHLSQYNQLLAAYDRQNTRGEMTNTQSLDTANKKWEELRWKVDEYIKTLQGANQLKFDTSDFQSAISELRTVMGLLSEIKKNGGKTDSGLTARQVLNGAFGANAIKASNYNKEFKKEIKASQGSVTDLAAEANKAFASVTNQITRMDKTMRDGLKFNVDTSKLEAAMQTLRQYQQQLEAIAKAGGNLNGKTAKMVLSDPGYVAAANQAKMEQSAVAANVATKREAEQANKNLANSENTVAQAIANSTNSARNQSQVLSDLKSMATQYLSVWGAQQFLSDMTNITGELELQERSLEVILGNASAAREMYSQIRDLSQMSPYSFEDLLKSHRQLAAFGIEAKDIFGTLKSLSDIGAGLDVDVSRLILAYGHTKSYGYLSGIQNRQFETAGIDLVGALTQHYNKLAEAEKKAGNSAQFVTRADIFKRMRDRSIPFEDVQDVIMDLDKPGGKFYNMQIRQYDTLGGKLRNLRNNYRIMQSEIGESNKGILAGGVDMINELTANWQKYANILKGIAYAYGSLKIAALVAGNGVVAANKKIFTNALTANQSAATTRFLSQSHSWLDMMPFGIGKGDRAMWARAFGQHSNAPLGVESQEFKNIKSSTEYTNYTKQRIALMGNLTEQARKELLVESGLTEARATQIMQFPAWKRGLLGVRLSFVALGQSIKAVSLALLTNPLVWITAAIGAISALSGKISDMQENAKTLGNNLGDAAKTNIEGLKETLSEYEELYTDRGGKPVNSFSKTSGIKNELHYVDLNQAQMEGRNLVDMFDDLRKKLESQSPIFDKDFYNIEKAQDQSKRIEETFNTLKRLQYVNSAVDSMKSDVEASVSQGAPKHWYSFWQWGKGEDYMTNAKDYQDSYQEFVNSFSVDDNTWNRLSQEQKAKIEEYIKDLGLTRKDAVAKYLVDTGDNSVATKVGANKDALDNIVGNMFYHGGDEKEINSNSADVKRIATTLSNDFLATFKDNAPAMSEAFGMIMNQMMADAKIGNDDVKQKLADEMAQAVYDAMARVNPKQANDFINTYFEQSLGQRINNTLQNSLNPHMSNSDAKKQAEQTIEAQIKAYQKVSPKFANWWGRIGKESQKKFREEWMKSAAGIIDLVTGSKGWQKRAYDFHIPINFKTDVDYTDFINDVRKKIKEGEEKLKANKKRIQFLVGVDFTPDFQFKDSKSAKKMLQTFQTAAKKALDKANSFTRAHRDKNGLVYGADWTRLQQLRNNAESLQDYVDIIKPLVNDLSYLEDQHQDIYDNGKQKDKKNKGRHNGSYQDPYAKRWDERIRVMKEANEWYEKWKKEIGDTAAIDRVSEKYGDIFKEWRTDKLLPMDFDVKDIADIEKYVKKINEDAMARYRIQKNSKKYNNGQEALRVARTAHDVLEDIQYEKFTKQSEEWASKESLYLDRLTKQWDLYDKVRKATGNRDLAVRLSGFNGDEFVNQADALKNHIASEITNFNLKGADGAALGINFSDVLGMSDEQIEDKVKNLFGNNEKYSTQIKAIVADLKKWRDLQQQINDDGAETYATLIGSVESYGNTIKKLNEDLQETIDKLQTARNNGVISQSDYERGVEVKTAQTDLKKYEATAATQLYMGAAVNNMTRSQANKVYDAYIDELNNAFKKGAISAKDYADKVKKVNEQYGKINTTTSDATAMITGGLDGLLSNRQQKAQSMIDQGAQDYEKYQSAFEEANKVGDYKGMMEAQGGMDKAEAMSETGSEMMKGAGQAAQTVAIIDKIVKTINANVQSLKALFDDIANSLDTFGGDAEKFKSSNGYAFVSGFASASQGATDAWNSLKSGNMMGVLEGGYRSIMSFPEAFARAHDARRQRKIDKIAEDISKIEGYTEIISKAQERALGYDDKSVNAAYKSYYDSNEYLAEVKNKRSFWGTIAGIATGFSLGDPGLGATLTAAGATRDLVSKRGYHYEYKNTEGAAGEAMRKYYAELMGDSDVNSYQQQLNLIIQKRKDYIGMYNEEDSKKKKNKQSLEEYKEKIADLDDQIKYFGQDLAKNLWSIDIKSWADQISDGLVTAFENGEDAGKAFKDSVRSIMQSVMGNIMKLSIIEPMFKPLQDSLDSLMTNGMKKGTSINDLGRQASALASDFLSQNANAIITASTEFLNGAELGLNNAGLTLLNDSSSTLSSGISSASEESVDALTGQLAAMRQDVSIIRLQDTMFYNEAWPDYVKNMTSGVSYLQNIDSNVLAIRNLMSENGALYEQVRTLRDDLHSIVTQQKHIKID